MKLIKSIMTKNPCYKAGRKIKVKGLMLHSVGCPQPRASVFIHNWNNENYDRACVHAFIDGNDGTVYQTLPWDHRGWHGGGASNNTHIGVEMCEPGCIRYTGGASFKVDEGKLDEARAVAKRTYEAAVKLFAMLCKEYGLNPVEDGVIVSHAEGYRRGIASNHGDPEHLWRQLGMGYSMDEFRRDVAKLVRGEKAEESAKSEPMDSAEPKEEVKCPFRVRVNITDLNIRKGAGTNTAKTGRYTGKGVFTIVEVREGKGSDKGWGRLKSGVGWISLEYCERV